MPRQTPRLPGPADLVVKRLAFERSAREWTTTEVARRLTESGFRISQSSVWSIENDRRRKITFAEAVAFAELYELTLEELTDIPRDITGEEVSALLEEAFAVRRDANALLGRVVALSKRINAFNADPPEQLDDLYEYLGITAFGLPLENLKTALTEAADSAVEIARALPRQGFVISFGSGAAETDQ